MYTCKDCLWSDGCDCSGICEHYYPSDINEEEKLIEEEYELDLKERAETYQEIVEEQNS